MSKTRNSSFKKSRSQISEQEHEIKKLLQMKDMTLWQLARALDTESNCVTAAVSNLKKRGEVFEVGEFYNEETKRHQTLLRLADEPKPVASKLPKSEVISSLRIQNEDLLARLSRMKAQQETIVSVFRLLVEQDEKLAALAKEFIATKGGQRGA